MSQTEATPTEVPSADPAHGEILDMRGAAKFLGMGYGFLRSLRNQKLGPTPTFMVGKRPRWSIDALRAWVREQDAKRERRR